MPRKRGAGAFPDVLKAQHFDSGISLIRRLAIRMARYSGVGTSLFDQQIVSGTIGNLVGAFLMQLVGSPSNRPPFGHLWGLGGVPAIYNGGGKATPIFDAWANQDTDVAQLTVDIGTQTLSGGEIGIVMRGTNDDAQSLVFMTSGTGGGGGGGGAGWFGDGFDGTIILTNTPPSTDAAVTNHVSGSAMGCIFSPSTDPWNSGTRAIPLAYAVPGADLITAVGALPGIDATTTYYFFTRDCYPTTLTISDKVAAVPSQVAIIASVAINGPGTGLGIVCGDGDVAYAFAQGGFQNDIVLGRGIAIGPCQLNYGGSSYGMIGGWNPPRQLSGAATYAGGAGQTASNPPFDETTLDAMTLLGIFWSGNGGSDGTRAGGSGTGGGIIQGNPLHALPFSGIGKSSFAASGLGGAITFGGASGGGGACSGNGNFDAHGGLGGYGGASILLRCKAWGSNLAIKARGGKGQPGVGGSGSKACGGGGGGNGGYATLMTDTASPSPTTDFSPGAGGAGVFGGAAGTSGLATGVLLTPSTH